MSNIEAVFGKSGILASTFPGYEPRPTQVRMTSIIEQGISEEKHVFVEGPCGAGKSLSYIVPAAYHVNEYKGSRVVIATANIALQEQLIYKDLPAMAKILPFEFSFALLKGINNYACKVKLNVLNNKDLFADQASTQQMGQILEWLDRTRTGDVSELPFVPLHQVWSRCSVSSDDCLGSECGQYNSCYGVLAKRQAAASQIIVTNYHMLFSHFSVLAAGGKGILPEFDVLIMDEAHEAAEIARDFFGFKITDRSVSQLAGMVKNTLKDEPLSKKLANASTLFFADVAGYSKNKEYKIRLKKPGFCDPSDLTKLLKLVANKAKDELDDLIDSDDKSSRKSTLANIMSRSMKAVHSIESAVSQEDKNMVYWIESEEGRTTLASKMIVTGPSLGAHLFQDQIKSTICVSATMTTGSPEDPKAFDFIRHELGAPENVLKYVGESPFDFKKQALVVIPEMPDPKSQDYTSAVASATNAVIKSVGGKTLALFTSYKNLNATYNSVRNSGYRVMKQGDLPRNELMRIFREDVTSVLLGTDSFWTGVDIQGEALSALIIDRLPFANPTDPVIDAITERDKNAFINYMVPHAVIKFRQGVGRLIRTKTDTGVIVLLDNRIVSTKWGKDYFWASMPKNISAVRDLSQVNPFLLWASTNVFLQEVYSFVQKGESEKAVDVIHDKLASLVSQKAYAAINGCLQQVDLSKLNEMTIQSFISALAPFASKIEGRPQFLQKVQAHQVTV